MMQWGERQWRPEAQHSGADRRVELVRYAYKVGVVKNSGTAEMVGTKRKQKVTKVKKPVAV